MKASLTSTVFITYGLTWSFWHWSPVLLMHNHFLNREPEMHCSLSCWWRYCPSDKQLWTPETWADCKWECRLLLGWWNVEKSTGVYNTNDFYRYTWFFHLHKLTSFWQRGEPQPGNARQILPKLWKLSQPLKWSSWIIPVLFHYFVVTHHSNVSNR